MPKRGSSDFVMIAIIVLALVGIGVVNTINRQLDPKEIERRKQEKQAEEERKQAEEQQKQAQAATAGKSGAPVVPDGDASQLVMLGEEAILGKPDGKPEITLAWQWTPEVQAEPAHVWNAIRAAEKGASFARIKVINVDARPDKKPGVYINDVLRLPAQSDGSLLAVSQAYQQLASMGARTGPSPPPAMASPGAPTNPTEPTEPTEKTNAAPAAP